MILTFSIPQFEEKIKAGTKIHTIREDKTNRWKVGTKIHPWMHNPRNVQKNPHPIDIESFYVVSIQKIDIWNDKEAGAMSIWIDENLLGMIFYEENGNIDHVSPTIKRLSRNDGFDSPKEFFDYFKDKCPFNGKLIHWTDFKY